MPRHNYNKYIPKSAKFQFIIILLDNFPSLAIQNPAYDRCCHPSLLFVEIQTKAFLIMKVSFALSG